MEKFPLDFTGDEQYNCSINRYDYTRRKQLCMPKVKHADHFFSCYNLEELGYAINHCSSCHDDVEYGYELSSRQFPCGCTIEYCCAAAESFSRQNLWKSPEKIQELIHKLHSLARKWEEDSE